MKSKCGSNSNLVEHAGLQDQQCRASEWWLRSDRRIPSLSSRWRTFGRHADADEVAAAAAEGGVAYPVHDLEFDGATLRVLPEEV